MIHTDGKPTIANSREWRLALIAERDAANDCPCSECDEHPDPDSLPGGYDNPSDPIDWNIDD